jgi:hypothetical protein
MLRPGAPPVSARVVASFAHDLAFADTPVPLILLMPIAPIAGFPLTLADSARPGQPGER